MNWLQWILVTGMALSAGACGVKGMPIPPQDPPWIGEGDYYRDLKKQQEETSEASKAKSEVNSNPSPSGR